MNPAEQVYRATDPLAGSPRGSGPDSPGEADSAAPKGALGLWDAVSIIVGIVVGAGIYQTAPFILKQVSSPTTALVAWGVGGVLSLIGALCYAELATAYPRDGGDIVYLSRAYGRWSGFLFGWVQLTVILPGSIGMMAFVFANYALRLFGDAFELQLGVISTFGFAGGAVFLLTLINILGVVFGKTVQNVLTAAKVLGLAAIIVAGFYAPTPDAWTQPGLSVEQLREVTFPTFEPSLGLAMVLILYTYGGWNDSAFVAAEVRDGRKNITRALVLGIVAITVLYMLVNVAYINSLGFPGAQESSQIAADVLNRPFGKGGVTVMCLLVMTSALGAINGLIFTGARVYSTIGKDYPLLSWMGGWDRRHGAPVPALVTQGVLALALIFLVGTRDGRTYINRLLAQTQVGTKEVTVQGKKGPEVKEEGIYLLAPMRWEASYLEGAKGMPEGEKAAELAKGGFDTLLTCTAPVFWGFFLLTGVSLFVLRERDRATERPFKVPLYPELPLVFCISCSYMLYSSIAYALLREWKGGLFLLGVAPLLLGVILYRISQVMGLAGREAGGSNE
jgi:amino acid transporter